MYHLARTCQFQPIRSAKKLVQILTFFQSLQICARGRGSRDSYMETINPICGHNRPLPAQTKKTGTVTGRWAVLVDLVKCRKAFDLNDRDLAVLRGLISCLPGSDTGKTFVFASNVTLSNRIDGMNERTLRRHLAKLVAAGMITRHDSPNRKRYVRRNHLGEPSRAFGFDLAPLFDRQIEISAAATQCAVTADTVAILRENLSLLRHRLSVTHPTLAEEARKALRRFLTPDALLAIISDLQAHLDTTDLPASTLTLTANDSSIVRHKQKSIKDNIDAKEYLEQVSVENPSQDNESIVKHDAALPSLGAVIAACPDSCEFAYEPIETWPDLMRFAAVLAPILRIDAGALNFARQSMGAVAAAVSVICILQMGPRIRSAGAYLRSLSDRASLGRFSTLTLVNTLIGRQFPNGSTAQP